MDTNKDELVQIYNKNAKGGDYVHDVYQDIVNSDGRVIEKHVTKRYRSEAGAFAQVPRWVADLWKKQAPGVIVDSADVGAPSTGFQVPNDRVLKVEAENADLKNRIAVLEDAIKALK
jgi:hypothetical protein